MIVVVDTNFVFSGILSPRGTISDLLLNSSNTFDFYSPTSLSDELEEHHQKLSALSGLSDIELNFLKRTIMNKINLIDLESIPLTSWGEASELTKNVDEFDIPFIALSLALGAPLLTGDKKLKKGLEEKGVNWIFTFKILMPYFDFLVVLSNFNSWQYF